MRQFVLTPICCLYLFAAGRAEPPKRYEIQVSGGPNDLVNIPVRFSLRQINNGEAVRLVDAAGNELPVQRANFTTSGDFVFLLSRLAGNETLNLTGTQTSARKDLECCAWLDAGEGWAELRFGSRPVLRYVRPKFDDTTKEKRDQTYKPFHHVYSPDGKRLVTNGPGGIYPHHRGIFLGFNKVGYGGREADTWHCRGGAYQSHAFSCWQGAGPVFGEHSAHINWHGPGKDVFATETRTVRVYNLSNGTLIDFETEIRGNLSVPVKLTGDPQHAGVQFRADNEVNEKTKAQTYFLRPDGKGKPGETRNYDPKTKLGPKNQPWNAMSFVLGNKRYTVVYLDHPSNPKPSYWAERDYGRFGSFFEATVTRDKPMTARYRLWLQEGEMTVAQCEALYRAFADPVKVEIKELP